MQLPALCPNVERWLMADVDTRRSAPFETLDAAMAEFPTTPIDDEQLGAAMLYSSGTTGQPKGILRPLPDVAPERGARRSWSSCQTMFRFREGMTLPVAGAAVPLGAAGERRRRTMRLGGTSVIMEHFDPAQFLDLVERYRITHSQMVPTMFSPAAQAARRRARARPTCRRSRCIIHAAAPCPVPVKQQMIEWFGPIIIEYYGATEANGFTFCDSRGVARPPGHGRQVHPRRAADPRRRRQRACRPGTPGTVWFEGATNFEYYHDAGQDGREPRTRPATRARSATSATSTTTATSTSPTARRT